MAIEEQLITKNLELWTSAVKEKRAAGREKSRKKENHGTKKLRELILDLAIKGKLAQADPKDEPASELLAHILNTKDRLAEDGLIKKQKSLERIEDHELPFAIATNWEWVRLGEIADIVRGVTYRKADASDIKSPNTMPLMRANNIDGELNYNNLIHIPSGLVKDNQGIREGDVLIAMSSGSADLVGKAAQAKEDLGKTFGAFCGVVRSFTPALFDYFGFFFQTPFYRKQTRESGKGIGIQNLNQEALSSLLVPIPPLAEQHRIVAKVNELMALCDQLEEEQENNLETHETLVSTLLGALTSAATDASHFADAWQRIQDNFDILFKTESSIDQLKQTILQLAVMGKLVPQDLEKEQVLDLVVDKIHTSGPEATTPFELPPSWLWSHLNQLADINGGFAFKSGNYNNNGTRVVRISDFDEYGFKSGKIVRHEFSAELEKFRLIEGDILMAMTGGTVGKSFHVKSLDEPMIVNQRVATIRASKAIVSHFLHIVIQSKGVQEEINKAKNSTNDNISMKQIKSFLVPVPPLAEQHRIINKVDELMGLCDQLKASIHSAQDTQLKLADSIVEQAIHSPA